MNADLVHQGIQRLGWFNAVYGAAVAFNSIVFRVVAGVIGAVPVDAVAIVTALEFVLNGILEVPLGYVADRFGRVRSTIIGIALIISALTCIYVALQVPSPELKFALIIIDGICLGFAKPLISGSIHAFYEDAIRFHAGNDPELVKEIDNSFTKSSQFGKYIPLLAISAALVLLYTMQSVALVEHVFLVGIALYLYLVVQVGRDLKFLGDRQQEPDGNLKSLVKIFFTEPRAQLAVFVRLAFFMLGVVIAGYMVITVLRQVEEASVMFWVLLVCYSAGQALAPLVRGLTLTKLHAWLGEKAYLYALVIVQLLVAMAMVPVVQGGHPIALAVGTFLYTTIFFVTYGALGLVSIDILNPVIPSSLRATALSMLNIPAFIGVGLYSWYLKVWRDGTPPILEMFYSAALFAFVTLLGLAFYLNTRREKKA